MKNKKWTRETTFHHPVAGPSSVDRTKLAIRWVDGLSESERYELLAKNELELFQVEIPEEAAEGEGRPLSGVNQTAGLSWVVRMGGGVIRKDTLEKLESTDQVAWISPALRAGRGSDETASLFCVNPTRLYVAEEAQSLLADREGGDLRVSADSRRRSRIPGMVAIEVAEPSVAAGRSSLEAAEALQTLLRERGDLRTEKPLIRFENIPLLSPACTACGCRTTPAEIVPDDPEFPEQWGLQRIQAPHAWNYTQGDPDVVVAVIDEGVELGHPDLSLHPQSWNASSDTPDGSPVGNHGTPCAGLVAATIDNAQGVAGVAGRCRVMAVATSTWADIDIAEGLYFATDNGAKVVSMSFGVYPSWGFWDFDLIRDALQYALDHDLVLIAASGNENGPQSRFPGSDSRTLCVGGTNRADLRKAIGDSSSEAWWGASFGPDLDVVAPCLENPSTDRLGAAGYTPGDYIPDFNGTSSATPLVAGLAALLRSLRPELPNETVREIIERTCDKVSPATYPYALTAGKPNGTWHQEVGYGRVNAERALQVACEYGEHGAEKECKEIKMCLEPTPCDCRSPAAPPWKPFDQCLYWYEPRIIPVNPDTQVRCQLRIVVEHCLKLLGRQQGPLLYTTTLLPGETLRLYHYDRYRRVRSAEQRVSIHSSLRQTVGALWESRNTTRRETFTEILRATREDSDTGALVGGILGGPLGAAIGSLFDGEETTRSSRTTVRLEEMSSEFASLLVTATQQVETEHSLVVSTYEDEEHRGVTSRTLVNHNDCYAVTYFVRRVNECYRLLSRVLRIEWRCPEGRGFGPWRPVRELDDRTLFDQVLRHLPREGEAIEDPRMITLPTAGAVYEAELAHCSSCEPTRELEKKVDLARAVGEARKAMVEAERLEIELQRRRTLLERGDLGPFERFALEGTAGDATETP